MSSLKYITYSLYISMTATFSLEASSTILKPIPLFISYLLIFQNPHGKGQGRKSEYFCRFRWNELHFFFFFKFLIGVVYKIFNLLTSRDDDYCMFLHFEIINL